MRRVYDKYTIKNVFRPCITETTICKIERGDTDVKLSSLALIRSALALDITVTPL